METVEDISEGGYVVSYPDFKGAYYLHGYDGSGNSQC